MYRVAVVFLGLMLAGAAQPAYGQGTSFDADRSTCLRTEKMASEARIAVCTKVIESGQLAPMDLAAAHFRRASAWFEKGDKAQAVVDYSESLRLDPQQPGALNNRGVALEDDARAIADFTEALALDPDYILAYRNRGRRLDSLGEHVRAIEDYTRIVDLDPRDADAYRRRGHGEFNLRQYDLAALDFREVLGIKPDHTYALIWRYLSDARVFGPVEAGRELEAGSKDVDRTKWPGPVAHFLAGKLSADELRQSARQGDAKAQAEHTCEVDFYLGQWHVLGARADEARKLFERTVATCPKDFDEYRAAVAALKPVGDGIALSDADRDACGRAGTTPEAPVAACTSMTTSGQPVPTTLAGLYHRRGQAFAKQENWQRAIADFTEVLRRDPENARAYADRGDAWHAQGDTYKAMADFNASLHIAFDARVYGSRGEEWLGRGVYSSAIADLTKAIELDPDNARFISQRGLAWEKKGDLERARADYDESVRIGTGNATVYINRARYLLSKDDPDRALEDLDEALRRAPDDVTTHRDRAMVRIRQGAYELALADWNRVVQLDPGNDLSYFDRGLSAFLMGRFDIAVADLTEALSLNPNRSDVHLWQYLAQVRRDGPDSETERKLSNQRIYGIESGSVVFIQFMARDGERSYNEIYAPTSAEAWCQGDFLTGQRHILRNRPAQARAAFQYAAYNCAKNRFEYAAAVAELKRLGPN